MSNIASIEAIYAAFGSGNIPAILEHVADDVEWEYGVNSTDVPWLQPRRGRDGAAQFFTTLGALEFHKFEVKAVLDGGACVVALFELEVTVKVTGQRIVEKDEVHVWHFDDKGKVARFRHRVDTHQHWRAFHGK